MSHIATFKNQDGNLFIAGTGSSSFSKEWRIYSKGGWGHILGDEGSGYWIGKKILTTYIHYLDFSESPLDFSELIPTLKSRFPDRTSIIQTVYSNLKQKSQNLPPSVPLLM